MNNNKNYYEQYVILLVDDDSELNKVNSYELKNIGFTVHCAESGEEAIEIMNKQKQHIDIVIVDFYMPEFTGEDTVLAIREFSKDVVIILQTAFSSDISATESLNILDVQGYHDKTKGFDELLIWIISGIRTCEQRKKIKKLYEEIASANNLINNFKEKQSFLLNEINLVSLGQLVTGIPLTLKKSLTLLNMELRKIEKDLFTVANYESYKRKTTEKQERQRIYETYKSNSHDKIKNCIHIINTSIEFLDEKKSIFTKMADFDKPSKDRNLTLLFDLFISAELSSIYNIKLNIVKDVCTDKYLGNIGDIKFNKNASVILHLMQNILLNCARYITNYSDNQKEKQINLAIVPQYIDGKYTYIEILIILPNYSMSSVAKEKILQACKNGEPTLGLLSSKILLEKDFNGKLEFVEGSDNPKDNGIIFKITVPCT